MVILIHAKGYRRYRRYTEGVSGLSRSSGCPQLSLRLNNNETYVKASSTGTSTSGPIVAARA
jgi:hypothetical protein